MIINNSVNLLSMPSHRIIASVLARVNPAFNPVLARVAIFDQRCGVRLTHPQLERQEPESAAVQKES